VEPEKINLLSNREAKVSSGLIIVILNHLRIVKAAADSLVLFVHVAMNNLEIFLSHLFRELIVKIQKTKNPINKIRNHEITSGILTVCIKGKLF
jgi:hypothetical protein